MRGVSSPTTATMPEQAAAAGSTQALSPRALARIVLADRWHPLCKGSTHAGQKAPGDRLREVDCHFQKTLHKAVRASQSCGAAADAGQPRRTQGSHAARVRGGIPAARRAGRGGAGRAPAHPGDGARAQPRVQAAALHDLRHQHRHARRDARAQELRAGAARLSPPRRPHSKAGLSSYRRPGLRPVVRETPSAAKPSPALPEALLADAHLCKGTPATTRHAATPTRAGR